MVQFINLRKLTESNTNVLVCVNKIIHSEGQMLTSQNDIMSGTIFLFRWSTFCCQQWINQHDNIFYGTSPNIVFQFSTCIM